MISQPGPGSASGTSPQAAGDPGPQGEEVAHLTAQVAALNAQLGAATNLAGDLKRAILEAALDSVITIDADSRVVEWNGAAERTFGWPRADAVGRDVGELIIPPEYREAHRRGMAHYFATGEGPVLRQRVELEAVRADGSRFPIELAISPLPIGGEPHFTAYVRDISARKRTEAELRDREERLTATYESAFAGIAEVHPSGRFMRVNEEFCKITGRAREELETLSFADITDPADLSRELDLFRQQMSGEVRVYRIEKRFVHKDGRLVWVDLSASRVDDDEGRPAYGVRVVRDITDRRTAEQRQTLLINELNHRVKNTLATIQSFAAQTLRNAASTEEAREALEARLLALSRTHDILTRESWEGALLTEVVKVAIAPYGGEKRFEIRGPEVRLLPRLALPIAMVLQELATNAAKYGALSGESGRVRLHWDIAGEGPERNLSMQWAERGGPPVSAPTRKGFGTRLIERGLTGELGGKASLSYDPTGVTCTITAPLPAA